MLLCQLRVRESDSLEDVIQNGIVVLAEDVQVSA
jgi:hypothetical protein